MIAVELTAGPPCVLCIIAVSAWLCILAELVNGMRWVVCAGQPREIWTLISFPDLQRTA